MSSTTTIPGRFFGTRTVVYPTMLLLQYSSQFPVLRTSHDHHNKVPPTQHAQKMNTTPGLSSHFSCISFLDLREHFWKISVWLAKPLSLKGRGISQLKTVPAIHCQRSCSGYCHNFPLFPLTRNVGSHHCSCGLML